MRLLTLLLLLMLWPSLLLLAASVKISDLPLKTSWSTNTYIEIADMSAATKSGKAALTNVLASTLGTGIGSLSPMWASTFSTTNIWMPNLQTGNVDIWTVPAGYRAMVISGMVTATNSSSQYTDAVKSGGQYYWLSSPFLASTNNPSNIRVSFIYDEGQSISVTNRDSGFNLVASIRYWPTNAPGNPHTAMLLGITSGSTNLLYTCPAGKRAGSLDGTFLTGTCTIITKTAEAGPRLKLWLVKSGSAIDADSFYLERTTSSSAPASTVIPELGPGDSIYITTDSTNLNQIVFTTFVEYPDR